MKIGIMTMHRVQNVGSVLQAYALQHKIEQLGYDAEIIDYVFPPLTENHFSPMDVINWGWNVINGFPMKKTKQKIELFRTSFFHCSKQTYYSRGELQANPPIYDIYCTGSDQVWNPRHIGVDTAFMLDFAPDTSPRISYASSFASKGIEEPYLSIYEKYLKKYKDITVREQAGVDIVKQMTGKNATITCDPTLLLTPKEWEEVSALSDIKLKDGYILVYLLGYMFNPRPYVYQIVKTIQKELNLPIYLFNGFTCDRIKLHTSKYKGMGPADFVKLVNGASFVITDSFHGAAFASIFNKPMIGVVKDSTTSDGRISTLRTLVNGCNSIVRYNQNIEVSPLQKQYYQCSLESLEKVRNDSISKLEKMIELNLP